MVNTERAKKGFPALSSHQGLANLARKHSVNMASEAQRRNELLRINHDGFGGRQSVAERSFGMNRMGENVAANWGQGENSIGKLVRGWMNSSGHRRNILKKWDSQGVGVYIDSKGAIYATQIFGSAW